MITAESRRFAGIVLLLLPAAMIGGVSLLSLLLWDEAFAANPLRRDLWRAGHAHAGVWLVLSLVMLRYVDEARLSAGARSFVRISAPLAAILAAVGFFGSVLSPDAVEPNALIYLVYAGGVTLLLGVVTLGIGLIRQ